MSKLTKTQYQLINHISRGRVWVYAPDMHATLDYQQCTRRLDWNRLARLELRGLISVPRRGQVEITDAGSRALADLFASL